MNIWDVHVPSKQDSVTYDDVVLLPESYESYKIGGALYDYSDVYLGASYNYLQFSTNHKTYPNKLIQ